MEPEIFKLQKEQQAAFNRLKKAFADCQKTGVLFYNNYGSLGAIDSQWIKEYDDTDKAYSILDKGQNCHNEIKIANEWADDSHFFQPTERYKRVITNAGISKAFEGF